MSAFYPGAGTDVVPIVMFPHITSWLLLDSQPRSEFGSKLDPGFERPKFLSHLDQVMTQIGFTKAVVNGDSLLYYNTKTNQSVRYETNTVFLDYIQSGRHLGYETLVLCGFDTESSRPPTRWKDSFRHIIVDSKSLQHGPPPKNKLISSMIYQTEWEYWLHHNMTREQIAKHVSINQCLNVGRKSERLLSKLWSPLEKCLPQNIAL
jgi:hypothetical protein